MSARHRFPGADSGDQTVLTLGDGPEFEGSDVSQQPLIDHDQKKYFKKPYSSSWGFPSSNFTNAFTSFTASAINNINSTILAQQQSQEQKPLIASNPSSVSDLLSLDRDAEEFLVMTARDRTSEFSTAIRSMQGRNIQRAVNVRDPKKAKQMQSYSEFMMVAKHVGKNIASTYNKLEKLTLLAKKKSIFDDRPQEINELTYIIKGDLNSLNQQIAKLQEISKSQRKSTSGKHLLSHSSNMVVALQAKLANMSNNFKQILEVRTENLKQQKTRRDQFSQNSVMPLSVRGGSSSTQGNLLLLEQQEQSSVAIDVGGGERGPLLQNNQQQQMMLYDDSDQYLQERAETTQHIESTIVELGGIFQQLAHMVKEQEEMVERIDTNIQDTELNIEAAHTEILKYFQSVSKNRWLMIKIFGVLIFFFMFFVIFMT